MFVKRLNGKCQIKLFMRVLTVLAILTAVNLIPSNSTPAIAKSTQETASISEDKAETVESLIKPFRHGNWGSWRVRKAAAEALVKIGEPAVEPLLKKLCDEEYNVREAAAEALGNIGDTKAVGPLIKRLDDKAWCVRRAAAEALGNIGDTKAVEPLIKALRDIDKNIHKAAARALGNIGDTKAVEPLIKALGDGKLNVNVREAAARALGKIGDTRAVEPLIKALGDEENYVRWFAAEALGKIVDTKAVEPLINALGDKSVGVRKAAAEALVKLGWEPVNQENEIKLNIAAQKWNELVKIGKPAVEPLIKALGDKSGSVREAAAEALVKLGWEPVNQENEIKLNIATQKWNELVKIGKPAAEPLIKLLGDNDWNVREAAARALGKIGDVRAVEPLIKLLGDRYQPVCKAAALALGDIGDTKAVEPLRKLLWDEQWYVREAAARALEKLNYKPRIHEKYIISFIKIHPGLLIFLATLSLTILGIAAILLIKKIGK